MEAIRSSETSVHTRSTQHHVPENVILQSLDSYELKKGNSKFDEGCSKLLDQRKQAKLQCLEDRSEINGDNLETSRHFRNKKREYLKDKIDELATNKKNKNIRDLYRGMDDFNRVTKLEVTS
jgi:flagellar motility protein MotE (MotC chaperone)